MKHFSILFALLKYRCKLLFVVAGIFLSIPAWSQLPTAQQVASQMRVGWNLGNTLEAICGENAWQMPPGVPCFTIGGMAPQTLACLTVVQWTMESAGGFVKLRNRATGLYLDGLGQTGNGSNLAQWNTKETSIQFHNCFNNPFRRI